MCSLRYLPSRQVPAVPKDWIGTCLSPSSEVLPGWQAYRTTPTASLAGSTPEIQEILYGPGKLWPCSLK